MRAVDADGREYGLQLATGDRVRLFKSTGGKFANGEGGNIGRNGLVLEVLAISDAGLTARSAKTGREGLIAWDSLTHKVGAFGSPTAMC